MGKSSNGPDLMDVLRAIRELEQETKTSITVLLQPDGFGAAPRWRIDVHAVLNRLVYWPNPAGAGVGCYFPHREVRTVEGALMRLLIDLEDELSKEDFRNLIRE